MNFIVFGGVKKTKMSQTQVEQLHFPWVLVAVVAVAGFLVFKIGQWGYDYVLWLFNRRLNSGHTSRKKKVVHKKKRKAQSSDEEDEEEEQDSSE